MHLHSPAVLPMVHALQLSLHPHTRAWALTAAAPSSPFPLQARHAALLVDSPEPSRMLVSLTLGPQMPLQEETEVPHTVGATHTGGKAKGSHTGGASCRGSCTWYIMWLGCPTWRVPRMVGAPTCCVPL